MLAKDVGFGGDNLLPGVRVAQYQLNCVPFRMEMGIHDMARAIRGVTLAVACVAYADRASGTLKFASCSPMERNRLTLTRVPGLEAGATVELKLPLTADSRDLASDWLPGVDAWVCRGRQGCDAVIKSRTRITRSSLTTISGDFEIEFIDGKKIQGPFRATKQKLGKRATCE